MIYFTLLSPSIINAQALRPDSTVAESPPIEQLEQRLDSAEIENRRLAEEIRELKRQLDSRVSQVFAPAPTPGSAAIQRIASDDVPPPIDVVPSVQPWVNIPQQPSTFNEYTLKYDNGLTITPTNFEDNPFSLKINSQNMFRYNGFARGADSWSDSAGNQNPISNSSNFQIPRGRLIFSGNVFRPNVSYLLNIDYNTVNSNPIGFRAYELGYSFNRSVQLYAGLGKVPGTREWLESGFAPLEGPDRSMATTFFRPSLSQGIWFKGEPVDHLYYHAMMSNGFNTLNLTPTQLNNRFCWSGSTWWEPWGDFGTGYADLQAHTAPVIRLGTSYTFALGQGSQSDGNGVENSLIRLSDGTLITQTGALAPGVTLQSYDISLLAMDVSYKFRGLSCSTEWYAQDLSRLEGNGPLPVSSTRAYGGFVQGGYFVVPQKVELYSRASFVTGHYGSGSETAGGVNWFLIPGKSNLRFTFDTAWLDNSPASQNRTGYVAGQTGLLVRTQITATY